MLPYEKSINKQVSCSWTTILIQNWKESRKKFRLRSDKPKDEVEKET
jgi:hypothetical protein